jgi:hypothetical protein
LLKKRPRGVCLTVDEIAGWVGSFNQYKAGGKGSDRDFWLSNWTGKSWTVVRKNLAEGYSTIPHPFVSVLGGIQPDRLGDLVGKDDGFLERVLFAYPDRLSPKTSRRAVDGSAWERVAAAILSRPMYEDQPRPAGEKADPNEKGESAGRPFYLNLDPGADELFFDHWCPRMDRFAADAARTQDRLKGVYAKLKGYAARLAVIAFALRVAGESGSIAVVTAADMAAGMALAEYFLAHARRVWDATSCDQRMGLASVVVEWVRRKCLAEFSRSELHRDLRRHVRQPEDWADPLRLLRQMNWVRYLDQPQAATGRKPTPRFEVNPQAFSQASVHSTSTLRHETPFSGETTRSVDGAA